MKQLTRWRKNAVVNIETRNGVFVLAQLLDSPNVQFFNHFHDNEKPKCSDINELENLFCIPVARQFIKKSKVFITDLEPNTKLKYNDVRIISVQNNDWVTLWENTEYEITFIFTGYGLGGQLIKNQWAEDEEVLSNDIDPNDKEIIEKYEINGVRIYPELNERLYLCSLFDKNIDLHKDLLFARELPYEYYRYMQIISGKVKLEEIGY